ncbi:MAG TPA: Gfo/Idh/MocA family oxidoreductase [Sedimentisphaerales bacterium]|nr:Gfo/Idh/MocA family oxidoreductase [Sedimentisphaerales bacterium]
MTKKAITRRSFLKRTVGITAGVIGFPYFVPSSALGKAGAVAPSNRITLGMIGVGGHGRNTNLKGFLGQPDAHILAVCDVDPEQIEKARGLVSAKYRNNDCAAYKDFREVLARSDIDAVMVSTPDHWHVPISIAAARAGKDICCEKPTLTIAEGRILSDTITKYGRVFQMSTEDRSIYVYHRMAELVRNGRIGRLHTIRVGLPGGWNVKGDAAKGRRRQQPPEGFGYDMWLGPAPYAPYAPGRCHWNFRWILDYSGGQLTDWGAHIVDTAQWGNDTERTGPTEIEGKGVFPEDSLYNTATEYRVEYKYANGVTMIVSSGQVNIRFEGTEGWVGNTGWRGKLQAEPESIMDSVIGPDEIHLYTEPAGEHRNFLDCVKSRKDPYFPVEVGHRCCSVLHLGNISMLLGRKLKWDPDKEIFPNDDEANRMLSRPMRSPWRL